MIPKIYLNKSNENWIVDRFIEEWYSYNKDYSTDEISVSDIIWLISPWTWKKVKKRHMKNKLVFCTIHHIDLDKFDNKALNEFKKMESFVDKFHTISKSNHKILSSITDKPITMIPFWANQKIWYPLEGKLNLRSKLNIKQESFLVGTFQRDTEGSDLMSPKLSKGPDQFLEIVKKMYEEKPNLEVVLAGHRRQYIIQELKKNGIPFHYYEMTDIEKLNELYNVLDLYIVASRVEGGPAAIFECALTKTPIISTDVGIASEILNPVSIFDMENFMKAKPDIKYANNNVSKFQIPEGFKAFKEEFNTLIKNEN